MKNKIMEAFTKMLSNVIEENPFPESSEAERPVDEEPMSNCCDVSFTYPGWPDSDICSECLEHADIWEEEDSDDYYKDMQEDR